MTIAFITMGREIGGASQDILTLSKGLHALGHQVYVISEAGVLDRELEGSGVLFLEAPMYTRSFPGLWRASRILRRFTFRYGFEVMNPQGMYTAMAAWLSTFGWKRSPFRIFTTIHMISSFRLYRYAWMLNIFSARIITESNCERNRLTGGGARRGKITVIPNSVDMERFSPEKTRPVLRREYGIPEDQFCFGIIARLSGEKRHGDFIEAAKSVHATHPGTRFFIVGDGVERDHIRAAINGSEDYIHMTGMRRDVPDVLKSLDAFVLCSEVESLPLSIREAMSMELPVITSDVGGVREAVLHGVTGLVVQPRSAEKLAESMGQLVRDPGKARRMGKEGRILCSINFELKDWSRKTEQFFLKHAHSS
jgi:glycosyltransferase involved in cell wall biosynthesis